MISLFSFWTFGDTGAAPPPEIVAELNDISVAFASDQGPIHLLPHEWLQLKRIRAIARRDERLALSALKLFKRRAKAARVALEVRAA